MDVRVTTLKKWQKEVRKCSSQHGFNWYPGDIDTMLLRLHSEVTEAGEAMRDNDIENFGEECADIFVRLLDICEVMDIDLETEVRKKHSYNISRPYKHGRKRK